MTYWTLKCGGVEKSLADWGLELPTRDLISHGASTVKLTLKVAGADVADLFAPNATATIYRGRTLTDGVYSGGTIFFFGRIVDTRGNEKVPTAQQSYELRDPWYWLERLTFRQMWYVGGWLIGGTVYDAGTTSLSKLILFVDINGNPMNVRQVVTEILNYAIAAGAPLQIGTIDPTHNAPLQAASSLTCAEALKRVLRCAPDCITFFDYTTTPPTLHVRQQSTLGAVTVALTAAKLTALDLTPLYSSKVPAVVLEYDTTGTLDGVTYYLPSFDIYPALSTGQEDGALVANIDLKGTTGNNVQQIIVTQAIAGLMDMDFWGEHDGTLNKLFNDSLVAGAKLYTSDIAFTNLKVEIEDVHGKWHDAELSGQDVADRADYPNQLISGALAPWMANVHRRERVTINADYDVYSTASGAPVKVGSHKHQTLSVVVETTNAGHGDGTPKTYTSFQGTYGEPQPAGLAQYFYNALNVLYWRGTVELTEAEAGGTQFLGALLNLSGGTGKFAAINALVSQVHEDLQHGATTVTLGPPAHLSPRELLDLLWFWRNRKIGDFYGRKTGYISGGNTQLSHKTGATRASGSSLPGKSALVVTEGDTNPANVIKQDPDNGVFSFDWDDGE